jgi:hypothetical protein
MSDIEDAKQLLTTLTKRQTASTENSKPMSSRPATSPTIHANRAVRLSVSKKKPRFRGRPVAGLLARSMQSSVCLVRLPDSPSI